MYETICISELLNGNRFGKSGQNMSETVPFWKLPDFILAASPHVLMSTCLQRLLAVKAGTSWVGHLSPSARSLKLLCYCVLDTFLGYTC